MIGLGIAKINIKPSKHLLENHSDVSWDLAIRAVLSPDKTRLNKRKGKDRFTYVKYFKEFTIEVHTKNDMIESIIWVINAFKMRR